MAVVNTRTDGPNGIAAWFIFTNIRGSERRRKPLQPVERDKRNLKGFAWKCFTSEWIDKQKIKYHGDKNNLKNQEKPWEHLNV